MLSFFPRGVLDEILNLIESVSEGFPSYFFVRRCQNFIGGIFDLVSKYNVGLKTLLRQGLSEPQFYGDLVYKFRKIIGKNDFPYHFKKIIVRYKQVG